MELPYTVEDLRSASLELIGANGVAECYLRPIAFFGYGELGVAATGNPVDVVIMSWPWGTYLGAEGLEKGIRVKISSWARIGPNMIPRVYAQYRPDYAINPVNPHLHNVPLQIAAERGVPAALVWLWFVITLFASLVGLFRSQSDTVPAAAALAAVAAMLAAGLFEYNFGDSEFLMLFLIIVTLPFAAVRSNA